MLLEDIARILGAEDFLEKVGVGKYAGMRLNIREFENDQKLKNKAVNLPEDYIKVNDVVLPPSQLEVNRMNGNGASFRESEIVPRTQLLSGLLAEMSIGFSVIEGTNTANMMRQESYLIYNLPMINKIVFVNDEEGCATYIVHGVETEEWREYMKKTKEELQSLSPDFISIIKYPNRNSDNHEEVWKENIKKILQIKIDVIREKIVDNVARIDQVPEGWKNEKSIRNELQISSQTFKKYVDIFHERHLEWVVKSRNKQGRLCRYYSPELISSIRKGVTKYDKAPADWKTVNMLAGLLSTTSSTLKKYSEKLRSSHPAWFSNFRDDSGHIFEYLSPELIAHIKNEINQYEFVPDGWLTEKNICSLFNIGMSTVQKYANLFRGTHPEWFQNFKHNGGMVFEYYSPEFIEKIRKESERYKLAPENWKTPFNTAISMNSSLPKIKEYVEPMRAVHPEWFKIYKNHRGQVLEYYSPELVEYIQNKFLQNKLVPDGWVTLKRLSKIVGVDSKTMKRIVEDLPKKDDDIMMFKNPQGKAYEHYSPELVQKLKDKIEERKILKKIKNL